MYELKNRLMPMYAAEGTQGGSETTKTEGEEADTDVEDIELDEGEEPIKAETDGQGRKMVPLKALQETRAKLKAIREKSTYTQSEIQRLARAEMNSPGSFRKELESLGFKGPEKTMEKIESKAESIQGKLDDLKTGEKPSAALQKEIDGLKKMQEQMVQGLQYMYRQNIERDYKHTMKELQSEMTSDYSPEERDIITNEAERLLARREVKSEREALSKAKKKYDDAYDKRIKRIASNAEETEKKRRGQPADLGPDALDFLKVDVDKIDDRKKRREAVEAGWGKIKGMSG